MPGNSKCSMNAYWMNQRIKEAKRIKFIRQDLTSRRDGTLKQLIFFFFPWKLLNYAASYKNPFWRQKSSLLDGTFGDLHKKGFLPVTGRRVSHAASDGGNSQCSSHRAAQFSQGALTKVTQALSSIRAASLRREPAQGAHQKPHEAPAEWGWRGLHPRLLLL